MIRGHDIDWLLSNLPATRGELREGLTVHVDYDEVYLDRLLRVARSQGKIACVNGLWYLRPGVSIDNH